MLDTDTKRRIDTARDILVGKVPDDPQRGSVRDGSTVDLPRRTESVPGSATPRTVPQGSANPGLNDASPLGLVKSASNGGTLPGFESPEPRAKAKAQPDDSDDEPERPTHPRDLEKSDLMYRLRQVLTEHGPCDRETVIKHTATALGFQRVSPQIVKSLANAIHAARRRQVLLKEDNLYTVQRGGVEAYDMEFLKEQFLAAVSEHGRVWMDREEAIRAFARWLGFSRTGAVIEDTARKLIKRLLLNGRLEKDGDRIRRL